MTQSLDIAAVRQALSQGGTNQAFALCLRQRRKALSEPEKFLWWDDMLRYVVTFAESRGETLQGDIPPRPHEDSSLPETIRTAADGLWTNILWKTPPEKPALSVV